MGPMYRAHSPRLPWALATQALTKVLHGLWNLLFTLPQTVTTGTRGASAHINS